MKRCKKCGEMMNMTVDYEWFCTSCQMYEEEILDDASAYEKLGRYM